MPHAIIECSTNADKHRASNGFIPAQAEIHLCHKKDRLRFSLYTGVTTDLVRRVWKHKNKVFTGFTSQYSVDKLVYYKIFDDVITSIAREKHIKKWERAWKTRCIYESNPEWDDLYESIAV